MIQIETRARGETPLARLTLRARESSGRSRYITGQWRLGGGPDNATQTRHGYLWPEGQTPT
jgi:hypothetical protein